MDRSRSEYFACSELREMFFNGLPPNFAFASKLSQRRTTMRKAFAYLMAMPLVFALAAPAQTSGGSTGSNGSGSTGSDASQTSGSGSAGASASQSSTGGSMGSTSSQGSTTGSMGNSSNTGNSGKVKGEKSLSGCIRSNNGSYMLQEKNGKMAMLNSSQDLSAHVGHTVKVRGTWEKGTGGMASGSANSGASNTSSGTMSSNSGSTDTSNTAGTGSASSNSSGTMSNNTNTANTQASTSSDMKKMKWDHKNGSFNVSSVDMVSDTCQMGDMSSMK
ncbi:MAG TPA: hypothetical protein VFZ99_00375 [Terriglobales bacterium]